MEVSFIIPAYNVAAYLPETIESLAAQTEQDFEVVVVDDCSTDGTARLLEAIVSGDLPPGPLKEAASKLRGRIRTVHLNRNTGGCYQPRKRAIEMANGSIVAPLDADDRVGPNYLERLLKRMRQTGASIVYPDMYSFDGVNSHKILPAPEFDADSVWEGRDLVIHTVGGWKFGAGGGLISRRLYLDCFSKYDSSISYNFADEVLTRQLLINADKVAFADEPYHYRQNPQSVTRKVTPALFMYLRSLRDLADLVKEEFGAGSPTSLQAERHLFHGFFDTVRLYAEVRSSRQLTPTLHSLALEQLRLSWHRIDWKAIRSEVSPYYYFLGRLGIRASLLLLPIYDKIKKR